MMLDNDYLEKQTALFHNGSKEIRLVKPIVDGAIIASFSSYQVSNQQPMDLHQAARYVSAGYQFGYNRAYQAGATHQGFLAERAMQAAVSAAANATATAL
jgi:hypothetical protein